MEPTLVAVTVMSLAMAVAMGAIAWRLLREERRRSDARVAALAELAACERASGGAQPPPFAPRPVARSSAPIPSPDRARRRAGVPADPGKQQARTAEVTTEITTEIATEVTTKRGTEPPTWDSLPLRPLEPDDAGVRWRRRGCSPPPPSSSRLGARIVALVAAALVMAAGIWGVWRLGARGRRRRAGGRSRRPSSCCRSPTTARATCCGSPAWSRTRRTAGSSATSWRWRSCSIDRAASSRAARAPLDAARLAPGDASPFAIVVGHAENVARYRLGFRAHDGRVLAHVDRRGDAAASGGAAAGAGRRSGRAHRPPAVGLTERPRNEPRKSPRKGADDSSSPFRCRIVPAPRPLRPRSARPRSSRAAGRRRRSRAASASGRASSSSTSP